MAACATTYYEPIRSKGRWADERNAKLMAQQAQSRRGVRTPEFYFTKHFDNSRLVKAADPVRAREMRVFSIAAAIVLTLLMVYGLQHFYAIESGYSVEAKKQIVDQLREENRQLRLTEAQMTQPGRIDVEVRKLGLDAPQPGQVVYPNAHPEMGTPVMAQVSAPVQPMR